MFLNFEQNEPRAFMKLFFYKKKNAIYGVQIPGQEFYLVCTK